MSRASARNQAGGRRTISGRHVLFGLIAFFAIVLVADGYMIYKAVSTFGGLETEDAYRKGLAYNDRIAVANAQAKRGWRDQLNYLPQSKRLRIALLDREGAGVSGLDITASLGRPATNRFDREFSFVQTGPGIYEAEIPAIESGWWTVGVQARRTAPDRRDATVYEAKRRLWIKP
ncbi:MAG: FixH family protein [Hyphomicrobium sp.]